MKIQSVSSVAQSCPTLCDPMNRSMPGLPVHHQLPEFTQTHVHWVSDAIQPSHPLSTPFPPAFNLSLHQGLFQWLSSLHQVAKVLEFQLQHQSFQWTPRTDLLYDGLVGSPCSPRDSQESSPRVFSNTTVWKLIYFKTFFSYTLHARLVTSVMSKLWDPMDNSPPGSSVHGILQARGRCCALLQGIFLTQGSNSHLLCLTCIGRQVLYHQHCLGNLVIP